MLSALGIALALWLASPPSNERPAQAGGEPRFCDLAIRSDAIDYGEFVDAARIRLPELRLREANGDAEPTCAGQLHGYVELRALADGRWELSLIGSDGRAWYRTLASEPDQAARALASSLANLVAAIEDASVEPDAVDVEVPPELADAAEPEPEPEPEPKPEPEPQPSERRLLLELGPRLAGALLVGLTPGAGLRGGGGGGGVDVRLPSGPSFALDVRSITRAAADIRLTRTRVSVGAGYVIRAGMFELPIIVSAMVEPWRVRLAGSPTPLGQPPLVGAGARVAPGLSVPVGPVRLRVGVPIGLELAVEAAPGGTTPAIARDPAAEPILRAGGLELSVGLELGVWIPARERE